MALTATESLLKINATNLVKISVPFMVAKMMLQHKLIWGNIHQCYCHKRF